MGTCVEAGNAEPITFDSGQGAATNSVCAGLMHTLVPVLLRAPRVAKSVFPLVRRCEEALLGLTQCEEGSRACLRGSSGQFLVLGYLS